MEAGVSSRAKRRSELVMEGSPAEIDGVPVLHAPSSGPLRAGLMFRVGRADETLATSGISHLVEHLALHRLGVADYHYNGVTGATTTQFLIQGAPEAVVEFLNSVCRSLRDLPMDRLETERRIVETEATHRPTGVNQQMPLWRHGARDFGLVSFPEMGMRRVTAEMVTDWTKTRFNRSNAVLWIAGEQIPPGLSLDLPNGQRWPLPTESSAVPVSPAYFFSDTPLIVMDAQVPRTRAAVLYARALERALFRELRQNQGLSYTATAAYSTDGRGQATLTAVADAQPGRTASVVEGFVAQLRKLAADDIDALELDAIRALELEALRDPDVEANLLPRRATDLLTGFPNATTAELIAGFQDATAADVRQVARIVGESALLMLPQQIVRPPIGFEAAPLFSRFSVVGRSYRSRADNRLSIVLGPDGVSLNTPNGPATVLFESCAAMLSWPDGARQLFGTDGINVKIEPGLYGIPAAALAQIDSAVARTVVVEMPPRDVSAVTRPSRLKYLTGRLRTWALPWRARFDQFAAFRGGARAVLLAVVLGLSIVVAVVLAIVLDEQRITYIAVAAAVTLFLRRRSLGHW